MYEPPHWTKPAVAPIAKRAEPSGGGGAPAAKPSPAPSIADMVDTIKSLKDGLRALADQVAGLTARVDEIDAAVRPPMLPQGVPLPAQTFERSGLRPLGIADFPSVADFAYASLWDKIQGSGDGMGTFVLPDLSGRTKES